MTCRNLMLMSVKPGDPVPRSCRVCGLGPCRDAVAPWPGEKAAEHAARVQAVINAKPKPDPLLTDYAITPHDLFFAAAMGALIGDKETRHSCTLIADAKGESVIPGTVLLGIAKEWADLAMKMRGKLDG